MAVMLDLAVQGAQMLLMLALSSSERLSCCPPGPVTVPVAWRSTLTSRSTGCATVTSSGGGASCGASPAHPLASTALPSAPHTARAKRRLGDARDGLRGR